MSRQPDTHPGTIVVPRWVQLAALPVLLLCAWFTLGAISQVLFIFLVAGLVALVLNPLVHGLHRVHVPRFVAVFLVYLVFVAGVVLVVALLWPPASRQLHTLAVTLPTMSDHADESLTRLQTVADQANLHVDVAQELKAALTAVADRIPQLTGNVFHVGVSVVRSGALLIIVVVISIYMLLDGPRIGRFVSGHFPTHSVSDGEEYVRRSKAAVVGYVKAQFLLSTILGTSVGLAMWFLSVIGAFPSGGRYALFFGVWAALMEAIPYLGPVLAAVPPTVVAVFDSPLSALWVILTFVLIQEVEGHVLVPVIIGSRFRVHPLVVIFAVLAGGELHGITGMLIAIPLIPLVKETWVFLRPRIHFEAWHDGGSRVLEAAVAELPLAGATQCRREDAAEQPGD